MPPDRRDERVELLDANRSDFIESYKEDADRITRDVRRRDGTTTQTSFAIHEDTLGSTPGAKFDWNWLRATKAPRLPTGGDKRRIAGLYPAGGCMTLCEGHAL